MPRLKALILFFLSVFFLLTPNPSAFTEDITITTYYPAPYGVYKEMRTKRMAIGDTYYDGGDYCWEGSCTNDIDNAADLIVEGKVGIGTAEPGEQLEVSGKIKLPRGTISEAGWPSGSYCILRAGGSCPPGFTPSVIQAAIGTHAHDLSPQEGPAGDSYASGSGFSNFYFYFCCK